MSALRQRRSLLKRDSPQRLLQKGRPASPSEPTAIGELLPSFAGIEKRNCEDFADGACRPFDAGPSESFAGSHLVGLSTKSQKRYRNTVDRIAGASRQNSGLSKQPLSIADIISLPFSRRSNRVNRRS